MNHLILILFEPIFDWMKFEILNLNIMSGKHNDQSKIYNCIFAYFINIYLKKIFNYNLIKIYLKIMARTK